MNKVIPIGTLIGFLLITGILLSRPVQIGTPDSSIQSETYVPLDDADQAAHNTSTDSIPSTSAETTSQTNDTHSSTNASPDEHGESSTTSPAEEAAPASLAANLLTLVMLVLLQAVLGFDNLLYVSLESGRAPPDKQKMVRQVGIGLAIFFRIALLFILMQVIQFFQDPIFSLNIGFLDGSFNIHSLIVLLGGAFIMYTAVKEISHMMKLEVHDHEEAKPRSIRSIITLIILMNIVFSFDSILSAMALSDTFWVMASAIIIGGILMIVLSDSVSNFLKRNRMYEVLGLFVLFVVGIMLLTEGGHLAHMHILGTAITPMTKVTFYFVIVVLVLVDIVQGRYQRKIMMADTGH